VVEVPARVLRTLACSRATTARALSLFPASLLLAEQLALRPAFSFFLRRARRNRGALTVVPSSRTAKWPRPEVDAAFGASFLATVPASPRPQTTRRTGPAASRITVTEVGTDGRVRDQRTSMSPTFGSLRRPSSKTLNRLLAVNRIDCRESLRDLNRGGATRGPFRFPVVESKKFR